MIAMIKIAMPRMRLLMMKIPRKRMIIPIGIQMWMILLIAIHLLEKALTIQSLLTVNPPVPPTLL